MSEPTAKWAARAEDAAEALGIMRKAAIERRARVRELEAVLNEVVTAYNAIPGPCPDCGKTAYDGGHDNDCIVPYARKILWAHVLAKAPPTR